MENLSSYDVSIFQMQLFVTAARELNFSRTALLMNLEQSTLSKRIATLEQLLGVKLFTRDTRPISLTPEGELLCIKWKALLEQFDDSITALHRCQNLTRNKLTVCIIDSFNTVNVIPSISRQMHDHFPELSLTFEYLSFSKWRQKLFANEVDIVLTVLFESQNVDESCKWERINVCPKSVCMLKNNPLGKKPQLTFDDLKSQKFVMISPDESPEYCSFVFGLCKEHGFTPTIARYATNAHGLLSTLQADNEVVICDTILRDFQNPHLASRPLPGLDSGMIAVMKKSNPSPYLMPFIDLLKQNYVI